MADDRVRSSRSGLDKGIYILFEILEVAILSLTSVFLVSVFLYKQVTVNGDSMFPTLHDKDRVLLMKYILSQPKNGDIVVVTNARIPGHENLIKRIIASGGQKIRVDAKKGEVYVDGVLQNEPYIKEPTKTLMDLKNNVEVLIPPDCYFVMGDARNDSTDSRAAIVGFVSRKNLLGKVYYIVMPFSRFRWLY
ncbi:MAG: signal peptidase I [Oscillospiraceae bacterium]|nr:signal peptidase I [Oscillospiraceae bacterium]